MLHLFIPPSILSPFFIFNLRKSLSILLIFLRNQLLVLLIFSIAFLFLYVVTMLYYELLWYKPLEGEGYLKYYTKKRKAPPYLYGMEGNVLSFAKRFISTEEFSPLLWRFILFYQYIPLYYGLISHGCIAKGHR